MLQVQNPLDPEGSPAIDDTPSSKKSHLRHRLYLAVALVPAALCYFFDPLQRQGGATSSDRSLIVTYKIRLSHTLSRPLNLVVQAARFLLAPCCPQATRRSKSIIKGFTSTRRGSISMPELPNCTVGGTRALGRIKRQVVPPFAGIDTLSHTKILFMVGVGT